MATINLLPQALALKGKDKIFVEGLRKFVIIGFVIFITAVLGITGYLIYTSLRTRASMGAEESLKAQIGALTQTEQSFFLIKDRISKIKTVLAKESSNEQIVTLSNFLNSLPSGVRILEIQITAQKVNLSIVFSTPTAFGAFYQNIIQSDLYGTAVLKSLSFNPSAGYIATLELTKK